VITEANDHVITEEQGILMSEVRRAADIKVSGGY
jgi:hypothetical protein